MSKSTWLAAARSGSIPSRLAALGAASVAAAVAMIPMAHAGTPTPKSASDAGTTPDPGTGAGASSRKLAVRPLDDAGAPNYGTQKVRVGVQRADGSTFPAGSTLVGTTIQAVQTGPEEGADGTVTCTVTDDPLYPAQPEGSDQSEDPAPSEDLNPIANCAFPDGYTAFGSYYVGAGNSVTFTETAPPDGPGMLADEQTYTVGPCVLPDGTPDASGLPDCGAISPVNLAPAAPSVRTRAVAAPMAVPAGLPFLAPPVVFVVRPAAVLVPPVATDDSAATTAGTALMIPVLANDDARGGGTLTISAVTSPAHGTAAVVGSGVRYTPAAGYVGTDTFTYTATTPAGSSTATVTVTVAAAPAAVVPPPLAADDTATTSAGTTVSVPVLANDDARGGGTLAISAVTAPAHGTAVVAGSGLSYTPASGFAGTDTFTYTVTTPYGSSTATVTVTVTVPTPSSTARSTPAPKSPSRSTPAPTESVPPAPSHGVLAKSTSRSPSPARTPLAATGVHTESYLGTGAGLVVVGGLLTLAGRRRRRAH